MTGSAPAANSGNETLTPTVHQKERQIYTTLVASKKIVSLLRETSRQGRRQYSLMENLPMNLTFSELEN